MKMIDTYPNPWDFHNTDKTHVSVDNFHRVVYYDLKEIAMGAPIGGHCFLETADKQKVKINDWCGGPPAWETDGQLIAIPVWTRKFLKGTFQQIGVVNTKTMELKIFAKKFRVLDLRSFDKTKIYGYDSPIHNTETVTFDIEKEKIETIIKLTK
jgi:hypothetical protein